MFVEEKDMRVNVQHVTCHELVHACSAHLKLPMWLNEGIAVLTVDHYAGRPTIRPETLAFMDDFEPKRKPPSYRELSRMDLEGIAYHGVRGYWLVRYLEEVHPGFLRHLFSNPQELRKIEPAMAEALGLDSENFWSKIDNVVVEHFNKLKLPP
jgi:hypothetical protein